MNEVFCPDCGSVLENAICRPCTATSRIEREDLTQNARSASPQTAQNSVFQTIGTMIGSMPLVTLREAVILEDRVSELTPFDIQDETIRYRIDGELARGGMGSVLRGRDPDLGRDVAVKILRDDLCKDPNMIRRFVDEARIGGQLQHPGVVPIYELGTLSDNRPFFSMKLVNGHTLAEILMERNGPEDDLPRLLSIFESIAQTMAYAHARGVVHRDLKPSNIMVGRFGEVQVMDWGLAKVLDRGDHASSPIDPADSDNVTDRAGDGREMSEAGTVLGTPSYMAPEQARGEIDQIDERSDVFALGSILCEILTGQPTFAGLHAKDILKRAASGYTEPALRRLEQSSISVDLIELTRECLSIDRDARPPDAAAVAARVTAFHNAVESRLQAAVRDRAVSAAQRVEEAKHRRLRAALAVTIVASTMLGGGLWLNARATSLRNQNAIERKVSESLIKSTEFRGKAKNSGEEGDVLFVQAREQAEKAQALLDAGGEDPKLIETVRRLQQELRDEQRDRQFLTGLENARLAKSETEMRPNDIAFMYEKAVPLFRETFKAYGLDPAAKEDVLDAVKRINARSPEIRSAAYSAIQEWRSLLKGFKLDRQDLEWLDAMAKNIEPGDALLKQMMTVFEETDIPKQREGLKRLASEADVEKIGPGPLNQLALRIEEMGDRPRAIFLLRKTREEYPSDFWTNCNLGLIALRTNPKENDLAARFLTVAIALRPKTEIPRQGLGLALVNSGKFEDALDCYLKLIDLNPKFHLAYLNAGVCLYRLKRNDEAISYMRKSVELMPNYQHGRYNLGTFLFRFGDVNEAIVHLAKAVELDPKSHPSRVNLGSAYLKVGRFDDAIEQFRLILDDDPTFMNARKDLGSALNLRAGGFSDEGVEHLKIALEFSRDQGGPYFFLGKALRAKGDLAEALDCLKRSVELSPSQADTWDLLGMVYNDLGMFDESIKACRKAIELNPNELEARLHLGLALHSKGDELGATDAIRKAVGIESTNSKSQITLALVLKELKQPDEAVTVLQKVLKREPKNITALGLLGSIQLDLKKYDDAIKTYESILELISDHPTAAEMLTKAKQLKSNPDPM